MSREDSRTVIPGEAKLPAKIEGKQRPALKVAIIEGQSAIRAGLQILINGSRGFHCTGALATTEEALEKMASEPPHIVLVDICFPGMSGTEGIPLLKKMFADDSARPHRL